MVWVKDGFAAAGLVAFIGCSFSLASIAQAILF
jgi:hypothetical protein